MHQIPPPPPSPPPPPPAPLGSRPPRKLPPITVSPEPSSSAGSKGSVRQNYKSWAPSSRTGYCLKEDIHCVRYECCSYLLLSIVPLDHETKNVEESSVTRFLDLNQAFLDNYVIGRVPASKVRRWLIQKSSTTYSPRAGILDTKKKRDLDPGKETFMALMGHLQGETNDNMVLWEMARGVTAALKAGACRVFKLFPEHPHYVHSFNVREGKCPPPESFHLEKVNSSQARLMLDTAELGTPLRLSRSDMSRRFPEAPLSLFHDSKLKKEDANNIMYVPLLTSDGRTSHVLELWRKEPYTAVDDEISAQFLTWGSLVHHYCNLYFDKKRERNMSDFLLDVVKAIFEEMISLDQLIKRILEFAQRLVNADRASLFLVDYRNFELVSTVFDLKFEPGQSRDVEKKEIRMPINRGIAGHVALSGETMNIPDAYSDYRFNREVDEKTGYKTISILCMPIKVQGKVIGVVQMVNKRDDESFHHDDEVAFEIFSNFFGLALHHARLYDRIMRKEQKYKVALEVLSYHNTCRENEVQAMLSDTDQVQADLNNFYLDPYQLNEFEKCKAVVTMFDDLFNLSKFDIMRVTRFILTVKKNYRTVPYHNFDHGWSVAHSMYVILKNDVKKRFNYKARLALFVACLCHDLDHRGYTNKYMSETASPLAAMYSTSTLEHHHFNITVTILQQDGHNIFSHISSEEYKEILGLIRQCILATDLAAFFPNLAKMKDLHEGETRFSWASCCHRDLAMAISMTAADLSASAKPWEIQIKTVKVIFEEFYDQGDKEREAGRTPIPMMDRNKPDEQPESQVGFLSQICIPCYKTLYRILPKTEPMYAMALMNLHHWKSKARHIQKKLLNEEVGSEDVVSEVMSIGDEVLQEEFLLEDEVFEAKETQADKEMETLAVACEAVEIDSAKGSNVKPEEMLWDEEEASDGSEDKIGGRLSKDIEGVSWIDEEGVVVRPNKSLKIFQSDLDDE